MARGLMQQGEGVVPPPARPDGRGALADVAAGAGMALLSLFFLINALRMPASSALWTWQNAPGLVPAAIGAVLLSLSTVLTARGLRSHRHSPTPVGSLPAWWSVATNWGAGRVLVALAFALVFILMMGRVPFGPLTAVFVFAMTLAFRGTTAAKAAIIGIATGITVTLVFTRLFLVPLP